MTGPVGMAIDDKEETAWGIDAGPGRRNQERPEGDHHDLLDSYSTVCVGHFAFHANECRKTLDLVIFAAR